MKMDELVLSFKSEIGKLKSDISTLVTKLSQLDNTTNAVKESMQSVNNTISPVSNTLNKVTKSASDFNNMDYSKLKSELKSVQAEYNRLSKMLDLEKSAAKDKGEGTKSKMAASPIAYTADNGKVVELAKNWQDAENKLKQYQQQIDILKEKMVDLGNVGQSNQPKIVPKPQGVQDVDNAAGNASGKVGKLGKALSLATSVMGSLNSTSIGHSKTLDKIGRTVGSITQKMKKFTLGLLGVRTAMSFMTKSVNAYLSFDSELQDSITNSYNMLGALLAPAIEYVAQLFAMAANYVTQFVSALTGIDLVARANAKALDTQAKAAKKAANAQRGLLGMDEITNLPTESGGIDAKQIGVDAIKTGDFFSNIVDALKNGEWHRAGEIVAEGIDNALSKINWKSALRKSKEIGTGIADFFNGVFELDWTQLGMTLANSLNLAIEFAYGFVEKFSFIRFGQNIGRLVNSWFANINWEDLAITISDGLIGIFTTISNFFETLDTDEISKSIATFLANIDWVGIAKAFFEMLKNSFSKIYDILSQVFGEGTAAIIMGIVIALKSISVILPIITFAMSPINLLMLGIGVAITGVIALIILLIKNFETVKKVGIAVGKAIYNTIAGVMNVLIGLLNLSLLSIRAVIVGIGKVVGKNWSLDTVKIPFFPALATGTNDIESEGLYHLHEGEAVVPKKYNPATGGYNNEQDNKQIIDLLYSLNANFIEYAERPTQINMNGRRVAETIYDDLRVVDTNKNMSTAVVRS